MKHPFAKVLVVHPDKIMAEFIAGLLQDYGINALPLTSALDAIEHVENMYFDVALVSDWMPPALPQLLFQVNRANWIEVLILHREPLDDDPEFVLGVGEAANERCWMCFLIEAAWHDGWYGEAGYEPGSGWTANLTASESAPRHAGRVSAAVFPLRESLPHPRSTHRVLPSSPSPRTTDNSPWTPSRSTRVPEAAGKIAWLLPTHAPVLLLASPRWSSPPNKLVANWGGNHIQ
jgi:hypothetical protein